MSPTGTTATTTATGAAASERDRSTAEALRVGTRFEPGKQLERRRQRFTTLEGSWSALSGLEVEGHEIHLGRGNALGAALHTALVDAAGVALGWQRGNVLAVYVHGLFENPNVLRALFGTEARPLEAVFDALADMVDKHFVPGAAMALLEKR